MDFKDVKDLIGEYIEVTCIHRKHVTIKRGVLISTSGRSLLISTHTCKDFISIPKSPHHVKNIKVIDREACFPV